MVAVLAEVTPVTIPVPDPTVALPLLLDHVPPGVEFDKLVVAPTQTVGVPVITPSELMVTLNA